MQEKRKKILLFCHLRILVFAQSSPFHPHFRIKGGGSSERYKWRTKDKIQTEILVSIIWLVFDQSSSAHPILESRGKGDLSLMEDGNPNVGFVYIYIWLFPHCHFNSQKPKQTKNSENVEKCQIIQKSQ